MVKPYISVIRYEIGPAKQHVFALCIKALHAITDFIQNEAFTRRWDRRHNLPRKQRSCWRPRKCFWCLVCKTGERLSESRPANTESQCFSTQRHETEFARGAASHALKKRAVTAHAAGDWLPGCRWSPVGHGNWTAPFCLDVSNYRNRD